MAEKPPAPTTIKRELRKLREYIDSGEDGPIAMRIAYAMETAIRWATEPTVGWPKPVREAKTNADILRKELEDIRGGYR